jgi:hypothetical protein
MSLQVEKMEKNMAKLTIEVAAEDLEKQCRMHTRKQKEEFPSLDSVKEKLQEK